MMNGVEARPREEPGDDTIVWLADGEAYAWLDTSGMYTNLTLLAFVATAGSLFGRYIAMFIPSASALFLLIGSVYWRERRSVAEIRLSPADRAERVTVRQRSGRTTTFPIDHLTRVVVTSVYPGAQKTASGTAVRLEFKRRRTLVTRNAFPAPPAEWFAALAAGGVPITQQRQGLIDVGPDFGPY